MDHQAAPTHIEHIGIAVKNLDDAIKLYSGLLGVPCYLIEEVKDQSVKTAFFRLGQTKIELLQSTTADGPVAKFMEKRGEGLHHIAYAFDDLPGALGTARSSGMQLIDPEPRSGAERLSIAFIHPRSTCGVLTEFCQK